MSLVLLLHLVAAVASISLRGLGRRGFLLCAAAPAAGVVWLVAQAQAVFDGERLTESLEWVPELGLVIGLQLDALGWLMGLLVCGVGVLVFIYGSQYMSDGPNVARLAGLLALFAAAMLGLVWSNQLLGLFVFWELTTVVSFLLVGFVDRSATARAAAWQALLVTGGGGLALLFGLVTVGVVTGTWSLDELTSNPPATSAALAAAGVAVLLGAFTKSAQVPFHGWLLGAMAAPTPVSAYLHSATMVAAGVWLVIRLDPVFSSFGWWHPVLLVVGGITAAWGGWRALAALDLKQLLAYSTVSALGVMFAVVGIGTPKALFAAVSILVAHALYKAALFMCVGAIDKRCGTRDLRKIGGLRSAMPGVAATMALAVASMAAVPATAGFVSKEAGVVAGIDAGGAAGLIGLAWLVLAGALAVAYGWRMWSGAFTGSRPEGLDTTGPTLGMWAPAGVLAITGLAFGLLPAIWTDWVADAAAVIDPKARGFELVAWPGWGLALTISLATLAVGALVAVLLAGRRSSAAADRHQTFDTLLAGLFRVATRVTSVLQPGSLPVYVGVILLVVVLPGAVVALAADLDFSRSELATNAAQFFTVVIVLVGAAGVASLRTRVAAVIALGIVGYGVAALFWLQGAPDLALTQALVETVIVAAFVLVFRRLPAQFRPVPPKRVVGALRIGVAAAVGLAVLVLVVTTVAPPRSNEPPTEQVIAEADPVGGGKNVVNVILTDVRALDTLGEITVVAAAALGALVLAGLTQSRVGVGRGDSVARSGQTRRADSQAELGAARSVVLDAVMRVIFPLIAAFSLFMLVAGHNAPGGGFIGGLIALAAIALRLLTGDWANATDRPRWLQPQQLIGFGLLIAVATLIWGGTAGGFGDQQVAEWTLPLLGDVKTTSALVFDIGVYALVIGAGVAILDALALGTRRQRSGDRREQVAEQQK